MMATPLPFLVAAARPAWDAGLSEDEIAAFMSEAMAGDYDHLLQTAMRWFDTV